MPRISKLIFIACFQLFTFCLYGTEQIGDKLIINNDTSWIEATPLEDYLEDKDSRLFGDILLEGECTALWRGYVATWKIENDSLFLVRIQLDYCSNNPIDYNISKEFNSDIVYAYWVNRTIRKPEGRFIQHGYYYDPIHEGEIIYSFENGLLVNRTKYSFINKVEGCVFPGEDFLADTIRTLIINEIEDAERQLIDTTKTTEIAVNFKRNGEINNIEIISNDKNYSKDQILLFTVAKRVLDDFPKLMPVYHPRYEPQFARVHINGYCLKKNLFKTNECNRY